VSEAKAGINYRFGGAALPPPTGSAQNISRNLLPPPVTDWTGCYAGVHAGGGIIDETLAGPTHDWGAAAGGQAGCNDQTGIMVFGLEGEAAWSTLVNRVGFSVGGVTGETSDRNRWNADIAARAGIAADHALIYSKVGVAAGAFDFFSGGNTTGITVDGSTTSSCSGAASNTPLRRTGAPSSNTTTSAICRGMSI
jgi:hypothetical protein